MDYGKIKKACIAQSRWSANVDSVDSDPTLLRQRNIALDSLSIDDKNLIKQLAASIALRDAAKSKAKKIKDDKEWNTVWHKKSN